MPYRITANSSPLRISPRGYAQGEESEFDSPEGTNVRRDSLVLIKMNCQMMHEKDIEQWKKFHTPKATRLLGKMRDEMHQELHTGGYSCVFSSGDI